MTINMTRCREKAKLNYELFQIGRGVRDHAWPRRILAALRKQDTQPGGQRINAACMIASVPLGA
ncbi:hypothetical protein IFT67_01110 [Sphingomonas sp. CFBP 13728]|uniref:hypothetical protein n=1 Tax=Sphingomonas sp. CFBP 13728 TaxID=2775294 RepID=UPI00177DEA2B|nr:hypothetical protein [Sphingomonas sp. CFBP 13728]MBD8617514.1 hypothetical protein [Sphingomonas sp. CFBP 13728]